MGRREGHHVRFSMYQCTGWRSPDRRRQLCHLRARQAHTARKHAFHGHATKRLVQLSKPFLSKNRPGAHAVNQHPVHMPASSYETCVDFSALRNQYLFNAHRYLLYRAPRKTLEACCCCTTAAARALPRVVVQCAAGVARNPVAGETKSTAAAHAAVGLERRRVPNC